ncbi:hypothetical protein ACH41E_23065 [Streptomyces sp. NPDC020412]|uniref:hypothetical protein n=1 Tax=Streptomyces sp. NPDC020412 TaxID=3365073 RepID=UPI0037BD21AD
MLLLVRAQLRRHGGGRGQAEASTDPAATVSAVRRLRVPRVFTISFPMSWVLASISDHHVVGRADGSIAVR